MRQEKRLPRRERERIRQRQELLAAALELFSQRGYYNVSMNEIAEKSEFAVGTIYRFFSTKEELYKAIMLSLAEKFNLAINKALEEGSGELEKLRNYVVSKGAIFMENAPIVRLYHAETRGISFNVKAGLHDDIRNQIKGIIHSVSLVFESGMQKKLFERIAEPYHLAVALESICNGFLFLWLEEPESYSYPEDPDVILNILFKGLVSPAQA